MGKNKSVEVVSQRKIQDRIVYRREKRLSVAYGKKTTGWRL